MLIFIIWGGSAAARWLGLRFRNPQGLGWLSVLNVLCVSWRSLRRADHTSRGVLPSMYVPLLSGIMKTLCIYN